jgi:hypothetical protein
MYGNGMLAQALETFTITTDSSEIIIGNFLLIQLIASIYNAFEDVFLKNIF